MLDITKKFIALSVDGASVNSGNKGGVHTIMSQEMAWIVFTGCLAHQLELALKSAWKNNFFELVNNMLLNSYLLY